eukprot:contig_2818_g567
MKANRFSSLSTITELVNVGRTKPVSPRTVRRAMQAQGFSSMAPAVKPWVSDANKAKRVRWVTERHPWDLEWNFVLFTDESSFEVRRPSRARVCSKPEERFLPGCVRPPFKSGRQSVMVWAGFSSRGRTPLYRVHGSMESAQYERLLEQEVYHHLMAHFGSSGGAWLQEDLAPCHASKRRKAAKAALGFKVLPWVGQSPDLNPIKNAWNELDRCMRAQETAPKNKVEHFVALCEERTVIPDASSRPLLTPCPVE